MTTVGAASRRRRPVLAVLAALLAGAACWYFGMDVPHAVTVTVALLAVGAAWWVAADGADAAGWESGSAAPGEGVRQDVSRLAWSLRAHRTGIPSAGLRRVHLLAAERLARRGLDVDSAEDRAAVERMLGSAGYSVLHPGERRIRIGAVIACLDALDRLERADRPLPATRRTTT